MSGIVAVSRDRDWFAAGWIYGTLIDQARTRVIEDSELDRCLMSGLGHAMIDLGGEEPGLAREVATLLAETAEAEIERARQGHLPPRTRNDAVYREALIELSAMLSAFVETPTTLGDEGTE